MEYLRGESLAARVAAVGPLPWPQIARIADEVMSALGVAHRVGVIHRDLKPDNIFLATDDAGEEHVKLLDFGVSKIRDSQTFQTTDSKVLGTPAYMAPEQAEGRHDLIGPGTDVWAMGAIIYEMVTGRVAFDAPSAPAILYRVCHGRPDPASELRPDMPKELGELLDWALDTQLRLGDVDELREEVRRVLGTVEGVTWAAPMRSRTLDVVRPAGHPAQRLATPVSMLAQGQSSFTRVVTPRPITQPRVDVGRAEPPSAPPLPRARGSRAWLIAGGVVLAGIAGAIAFVALRKPPMREPAPVEPAAVAQPEPVTVRPPDPVELPAPPPPSPASPVEVTIRSTPVGADVFRLPSETKVGKTPWVGTFERTDGMGVFVVKARGYHDAQVEIDLRSGGTQTVTLKKLAPTNRRPPIKDPGEGRRRGEPVNPFDKK
jgi:serine/threonine-protein kinase